MAFKLGLEEAGYIEGQNVTAEYHFPGGNEAVHGPFAAELLEGSRGPADRQIPAGHWSVIGRGRIAGDEGAG